MGVYKIGCRGCEIEVDRATKSYDQRNSPPGGGVKRETLEEGSQSENHPFSSKTQKIPP